MKIKVNIFHPVNNFAGILHSPHCVVQPEQCVQFF